MLPAVFATLFFACSAVFASRSARLVGVARANLSRLWLAAGLLALYAHTRGSGLRGAGLMVFLISGAVGFGLGDLALFAALPRIGSRLTALLVQCLAVPVAATFEWLWLGTTLSAAQAGCIVAILGGVSLAVAPERRELAALPGIADARGAARARREGLLFGVCAALGQAGGAVISRRAFALSADAGQAVDGGTAAYQRILGGLVVMTLGYAAGQWIFRPKVGSPAPPRAPWRHAWPWIAANTLAGPTLGVSCYQWALATTPSAIVLPIVATTPLAVIPLAYFLEGERPGARSLLGGALAVAGAVGLAMLK